MFFGNLFERCVIKAIPCFLNIIVPFKQIKDNFIYTEKFGELYMDADITLNNLIVNFLFLSISLINRVSSSNSTV